MAKSRFSPTEEPRHDWEITFPGSSVWTYRLLSGLVSASDAVFWLAKIYVVTMLIIAKLSLDIIGYACRRRGLRRRW